MGRKRVQSINLIFYFFKSRTGPISKAKRDGHGGGVRMPNHCESTCITVTARR